MNVFFIPQLGSMIYTMNGMVTQLKLRADQDGDLQGLSAHFCGDGFPDMLFDVHVVSALDFPNWVATTAKSNHVLNADSYKQVGAAIDRNGQADLSAGRSDVVPANRDPANSARSRATTDRQHSEACERSSQCSVS